MPSYTLHTKIVGHGTPIVLIHGIVASGRYWDTLVAELSAKHRVIIIDLLGFGRSPMPRDVVYDADTHVHAVAETLDSLEIRGPATIVGHSMGARVAVKFALKYPDRTAKLLLFNMPVYTSAQEARRAISKDKRLQKWLLFSPPFSSVVCYISCRALRPLIRHVTPLYARHQPRAVAQDVVLHTWQSFNQSMQSLIEANDIMAELSQVRCPVDLKYGEWDYRYVLANVETIELPPTVSLEVVSDAGHNLPLQKPHLAIQAILDASRGSAT